MAKYGEQGVLHGQGVGCTAEHFPCYFFKGFCSLVSITEKKIKLNKKLPFGEGRGGEGIQLGSFAIFGRDLILVGKVEELICREASWGKNFVLQWDETVMCKVQEKKVYQHHRNLKRLYTHHLWKSGVADVTGKGVTGRRFRVHSKAWQQGTTKLQSSTGWSTEHLWIISM